MAAEKSGTVHIGGRGIQHIGDWSIENGMITVTLRGSGSTKTGPLSGSEHMPDGLARLILGELIADYPEKAGQI